MSKEFKEKEQGRLSKMYGNFVQVPYSWYGLCRKYIIPKEVKEFKGKKENSIELNPMEINVLAYLGNYEECYVTNGTIAELFNLKKQTIEKYMKELRWVGFIKTFESKDSPAHTERRNIYVQHDVIKAVLKSNSNPYVIPYECKVSDICKIPDECHASTLQTSCDYPTDVMQVPYECHTNKKELENIKNNNKEVADAPVVEGKPSPLASNEAHQKETEIDFKNKVGLSNDSVKRAIERTIKEINVNGHSYQSMIDCLVREFTGAFYQCDKQAIIEYANTKLL